MPNCCEEVNRRAAYLATAAECAEARVAQLEAVLAELKLENHNLHHDTAVGLRRRLTLATEAGNKKDVREIEQKLEKHENRKAVLAA